MIKLNPAASTRQCTGRVQPGNTQASRALELWSALSVALAKCHIVNDCADPISKHDSVYRMLTAREASSAMINSESSDCNIIRTFAHLASTGASVGEKAVLVLKARNK